MMEWKRGHPTAEGQWLRMNAAHRMSVYCVILLDGVLVTAWGSNEESKILPVTHPKLDGWYWYGPLPRMPIEEPAWHKPPAPPATPAEALTA